MELTRHETAEAFLAHAGEFLGAREAEHNLILGLSSRLRMAPTMYGERPYFAVVEHQGRVGGAAMRPPPPNLILSELDHLDAIGPLLEDARAEFGSLPGVVGPKEAVARFAEAWGPAKLEIAQRAFRADHVDAPSAVPGRMRDYERRDRELTARWMDAFTEEALPEPPPESSEEFVDRREEDPDGGIVIWEDEGEPVSMAGFGGRTPNGIRIGPVYTPPERRGRGYGSAVTAAITQRLLAGGLRFCFLFTDLANPTSNSIYQRIGYEPVSDIDLWTFRG